MRRVVSLTTVLSCEALSALAPAAARAVEAAGVKQNSTVPSTATAPTAPPVATGPANVPFEEGNWEVVTKTENLTTYRKRVPGTNLYGVKGESDIDVPLAKMVFLFRDASRRHKWMPGIRGSGVLRDVSGSKKETDAVEYNDCKVPWPLKDRIFIFHKLMTFDRAAKRVTVHFKDAPTERGMEDDAHIRGIVDSHADMTALGEKRTHFVFDVILNPKGSVPSWFVNLIQSRWPAHLVRSTLEESKKPDVKDDEEVASWFK